MKQQTIKKCDLCWYGCSGKTTVKPLTKKDEFDELIINSPDNSNIQCPKCKRWFWKYLTENNYIMLKYLKPEVLERIKNGSN